MDATITSLILAVLNAIGIPILGVGMFMLYIAYQKTTALQRTTIEDIRKDMLASGTSLRPQNLYMAAKYKICSVFMTMRNEQF